MRRIHPDPDDSSCTACGAKFYSTGADVEHQNRCRAARPCRHCWQMFSSDEELVAHATFCEHRTQCMACFKQFESRSRLVSHIACAHQVLLISCKLCGFMCDSETAKSVHEARCPEASTGTVGGESPLDSRSRRQIPRSERHRAIAKRRVRPSGSGVSHRQQVKDQVSAGLSAAGDMMVRPSGSGVSRRQQMEETVAGDTSAAGDQAVVMEALTVTSVVAGMQPATRSSGTEHRAQQPSDSASGPTISVVQPRIVDLFHKLSLPKAMSLGSPSEINSNADFDWSGAAEHIQRIKKVDVLIAYLNKLNRKIPPLVMTFTPGAAIGDRLDEISEKFLSPELRKELYPVCVGGDGNCMVRAISRLIFGTERRFQEVRIRLAIEAARHEDRYLSEWHLTCGLSEEANAGDSSLVRYYMHTTPTCKDAEPVHLDPKNLSMLFKKELVRWSKARVWLSIWHLHMASNICGQAIRVVHPIPEEKHRDWHLFNRIIQPVNRGPANRGCDSGPLQIMFTSTVEGISMPTLSEIDHFVPLIRRSKDLMK